MAKWTQEEIDFLKDNYPIKGGVYCTKSLNRGYTSINNKASKLNIRVISENHFNFKDRIGEKFLTNEGYEVEVIKYEGVYKCTIQFNDTNKTVLHKVQYGNLIKGDVTNPYHPSVHGVGYIGIGKYKPKTDKKAVSVWRSMFSRCYSESYNNNFPTYKYVTVCEMWHNFQVFAEWFYENYKENFELDKDILVKGNNVYSNKTCSFVPKEVNYLFTKRQNRRGEYPIGVAVDKNGKFRATFTRDGIQVYLGRYSTPEEAFKAYKIAKEKYIKEVADIWKPYIDQKVYKAMYNYKIEITD